jgi:glycosyltransferase involved in cell wall biosynthesis
MGSGPIRVLVVGDTPNWCFSHRAQALLKYCPADITLDIVYYDQHSFNALVPPLYDVIFVLPSNMVGATRRLLNLLELDVPLIASHNSGMGRRALVLYECMAAADYVVINNYSVWAAIKTQCRQEVFNCCNISNGVDLGTFYETTPITERPHRILWTGSKAKIDSELSEEMQRGKPDVKGYHDILTPLSMLLSHRPKEEGWETEYMICDQGAGLEPDQMRDWYNSGSYLLCTSSSEGTPNIALEGAACGCVVVTSVVGNMPELIANHDNGVFAHDRSTGGFWDALQSARENREELAKSMAKRIAEWDWSCRAPYFYALFRRMAERKPPKGFTYLEKEPGAI